MLACRRLALAPAIARSQDQFFDPGGVQIRSVDYGQGEPIVPIHGLTANIESWNQSGVLTASPDVERGRHTTRAGALG